MPRLAPIPLKLTETERTQLQQVVNRHSAPQQIALRASIILLPDEGLIRNPDFKVTLLSRVFLPNDNKTRIALIDAWLNQPGRE